MYIENPKTKDSGILTAIPQTGRCPNNCKDCFFQSGRSYLEPLGENLPNLPLSNDFRIIRINDGNDSNIDRSVVESAAKQYKMYFFNTAIAVDLESFSGPVVLTVNPGEITDECFHKLLVIPANLMFVRFRVNSWNISLAREVVDYYTALRVPVVLTFMAYFEETIPSKYKDDYIFRKRTLNSYWAITTSAWRRIMAYFEDNPLVYSCGKIEGEKGTTLCSRCGNCIREYFNTIVRLDKGKQNGSSGKY